MRRWVQLALLTRQPHLSSTWSRHVAVTAIKSNHSEMVQNPASAHRTRPRIVLHTIALLLFLLCLLHMYRDSRYRLYARNSLQFEKKSTCSYIASQKTGTYFDPGEDGNGSNLHLAIKACQQPHRLRRLFLLENTFWSASMYTACGR